MPQVFAHLFVMITRQ